MTDRRGVVVFTEQQCTVDPGGALVGRATLGAVQSLSRATSCTLVARVRPVTEPGVPLLPFARAEGVPWSGVRALPRLIGRAWSLIGQHRVVVVYLPGVVGVVAGVLARLRRRSLVAVVVGNAAESLSSDVVPGWRGAAARWVLHRGSGWLTSRAAVVRYVTSRALQRVYPAGARARTVAASDVSLPETQREPRGRPAGPVRVLTVASMDQPYKGVPDLVDAVGRVRRAGGDITLRIAGTGRLLAEIERRAGAGGAVEFLGHLSGDALQDAYAGADAFALASWTEGMPRALVEAMAHGLPAVATDVGGVSEILGEPWVRRPRDVDDLATGLSALVSPDLDWHQVSAENLARAARLQHAAVAGDADFVAAVTHLLEAPL